MVPQARSAWSPSLTPLDRGPTCGSTRHTVVCGGCSCICLGSELNSLVDQELRQHLSTGEQRVPVRVDSALGRTLGRGSKPRAVRAPETQRTRSGWMRDVLDRRPLEVDPDPGVDPLEQ